MPNAVNQWNSLLPVTVKIKASEVYPINLLRKLHMANVTKPMDKVLFFWQALYQHNSHQAKTKVTQLCMKL